MSEQRIADLESECEQWLEVRHKLRDEIVRLEALLRGRDDFIVQRGLWAEFVSTLPQLDRPDEAQDAHRVMRQATAGEHHIARKIRAIPDLELSTPSEAEVAAAKAATIPNTSAKGS